MPTMDEQPIPCSTTLTIGDIAIPVPDYARHPERVPWIMPGVDRPLEYLIRGDAIGFLAKHSNALIPDGVTDQLYDSMLYSVHDPMTRGYLRWIAQKEMLGQDMCIVGDSGPAKRWLVMLYAFLTRREVRVVYLNRDTTEGDLKQRREMRGGSLVYDNQSAVSAALEGQLLVLEGLDKVERNVLPVINNLLENREMHLDNGEMLIHPARYDALLNDLIKTKKQRACHSLPGNAACENQEGHTLRRQAEEELRRMGLLRVSEHFRVVGITVPVPPYEGNPLDPPLRSRFQCLYVKIPPPAVLSTTFCTTMHGDVRKNGGAAQLKHPSDMMERMKNRVASIVQLCTSIESINASVSHLGNSAAVGDSPRTAMPLLHMGSFELSRVTHQLKLLPDAPVSEILARVFPWHLYAALSADKASKCALHVYQEETERRLAQYISVIRSCGLSFPLLCSAASEVTTELHTVPARRPRSSSQKTVVPTPRWNVAVRSETQGFDHAGGDIVNLERARSYISSAQLAGASDVNAMKSYTGLEEMEQLCNYVQLIENIRSVPPGVLGESEAKFPVVVADAVVATATKREVNESNSPSIYRVTIAMGLRALKCPGTIVVRKVCPTSEAVFTTEHYHVLQAMMQLHMCGSHIALVGEAGSGKTVIIRQFAHLLGYSTETMHLYADMTNKDLFQRRAVEKETGNTSWENSALVDAAIEGKLVILDGLEQLPNGLLSSLQHLLIDQNASLVDGTMLKHPEEYSILKTKMRVNDVATGQLRSPTDEEMRERRIYPIHPAFRVVATARVARSISGDSADASQGFVVSPDVTMMFSVVCMPSGRESSLAPVLLQLVRREMQLINVDGTHDCVGSSTTEEAEANVLQLLRFRKELEVLRLKDSKVPQLSFRHLLHLVRCAVRYPGDMLDSLSSALLLPLLPGVTATQLMHTQRLCGFRTPDDVSPGRSQGELRPVTPCSAGGPLAYRTFSIDGKPILRFTRGYTQKERALVPHVNAYYSNQLHERIIAWLAKQYAMGSNCLIIGNQGVGKNKVVDAFLSRIQVPRHYIQLHRDTTVGSLTINPSVEGGRVRWEDSPLVKAVQHGHCLVIDEIDKAPVEVVQVLKGLIEDRELRLGDGRRILCPTLCDTDSPSKPSRDTIIPMHPDFRVIVLANPPGFPFHGNDFFRECGDLFSSYVMSNPDAGSQLRVLREYGPKLPNALLERLISAFIQLQAGFEAGHLTYPFSLRELIAVVKHLSRFPQDGVYRALNNIFHFDARDENTLPYVRKVLHHHLYPLAAAGGMERLLPLRTGQARSLRQLPDVLSFPFSSTSLPGTAASPGMKMSLPVAVIHDDAALANVFLHAVHTASPVPLWVEVYPDSTFCSLDSAATDCEASEGGFTEWVGAVPLPFVRPETDTVLCLCPLGAYSMGSTSTPPVLCALLQRQDLTDGHPMQHLLAILPIPSTMIDSVPSLGGATTSSLQPGEVRFIDLTAFFPDSVRCLQLVDVCRTQHATVLEKAGWPRPGAFTFSEAFAPSPGMVNTDFPPVVMVADRQTGQLVLIDVVSGLYFDPDVVSGNADEAASLPTATSCMRHLEGAVLSVKLLDLVPSASAGCGIGALHVNALSGAVSYSVQHSNVLFVWSGTALVAVTLPASIAAICFLSDTVAKVELESDQERGRCLQGVLHLEIGENLAATFVLIPKEVDGVIVDQISLPVADGRDEGSALASKSGIRGVVIAHSTNPRVGNEELPPDVHANVAYSVIEGVEGDSVQLRLFASPDSKTPLFLNGDINVDGKRHQVVLGAPAVERVTDGGHCVSVTTVDLQKATVRQLAPYPVIAEGVCQLHDGATVPQSLLTIDSEQGTAYVYDAGTQQVLMADLDAERVQQRYNAWSAILGGSVETVGDASQSAYESNDYAMHYSKPKKKPSGSLKHGEVDDKEHHGGNNFAGGTGGTDTAGLGGLVGPYRLDKGFHVHQVSPEDKRKVPPHMVEEARRMGREALKERLREIDMSEEEYEQYTSLEKHVRPYISQLRSMLTGLRSVEGERSWRRGQTDGILDDGKLVEGIVGEKNIYKRRVKSDNADVFKQRQRKRVLFVLDVSASMYRFEGMDRRLTKLLESTIMVMEAFAGFDDKIDYAMIGHNGDSECLPLVSFGKPPPTQKERMAVCRRMWAYAQYCWSGDNTVEAMRRSVELVLADVGEAYFVFVISDANLPRYGITPGELTRIIQSRNEVQMFCIFIASLGAQASNLQKQLPPGHGYECMQTSGLPHVLRQIFTSARLL